MRCIEIIYPTNTLGTNTKINRNMRCIEISRPGKRSKTFFRLIETWDVLK